MRILQGDLVLPREIPSRTADHVLVEIRDVSLADAPSTVVALQELQQVPIVSGGRIPYQLSVPEMSTARSLALRAHVSIKGGAHVAPGDLLTTALYPVPSTGELLPLEAQLEVV
jgi:putative lipoprotein